MRWFALALGLATGLGAQETEMAERLFSSGERAYASKAYPEALETWNQLIQSAPKSAFSAHALLRLARYQLEVEKKPEAALPLLDRIKAEHLKTPWASEAMLLRGKILADRSRSPQEIKEALAEFNRVVDLFPDSAEVQEARFLMGSALFLQGQWGRALQNFTEALRQDPGSPLARKAQLQAAETLDLMGDTTGCLRMLQALLNHAPQSPESLEAAWRLQVRVKQRLLKPALRSEGPWPQGKVKWLKTPTLLATGPAGELYLYEDDLDRAFLLTNGELTAVGPVAKGAKAMIVTPAGQVWLVSPKTGVLKEDHQAGTPMTQSPTGAFRDGWGNLWLGDARASNIQVLTPDGPGRTFPVNASALAGLPGGGAVAASDAGRTLLFLDQDGQTKVTIPYGKDLPAPFKTVVALASDPLGHVAAIVDGDFEGVALWGPDGALLRSATFKALGIAGKFRALALDRQGGLILADRSNDLMIRLD
jgi:TolA-binding protein